MTLSRAITTEGWMEVTQLTWLNDKAKNNKVIEVGSYMGRSTLALAEYSEYVISVDNWKGPREVVLSDEFRSTLYQKFTSNLATYISVGRVIPLRINCRELTVDKLPRQPLFDMVFIDGDHSYESVCFDIKFWKPLIRKGGLICGHDYVYISDVSQAVKELLNEYEIQEPIHNMWAAIL